MIKVLPDSVANQIAAGEVIQRPASVVKELVENAVDAGSTQISVTVKDAGRTLIQIIDNGCGMSDTDARIAFERHATSKITSADDLSHLYTFGFRGEALPSISSIAEVELKTRRPEDETGTQIIINGANFVSQETVSCSVGSSFAVRNLFFNVPARRKFLKSDNVELKHVVNEFQRVALCHPEVEFKFTSNGTLIYNLPKGNIRQRIAGIFGKTSSANLISVNVDTSIAKIVGYVCKPEMARKTMGDQFFFANNRFFKSAYFQKAVINAYDQLIQYGAYPAFFLYISVNPQQIDVNIHPTKVEIKFADEQAMWQVLNAAVREALGKFALAPKIDFDMQRDIDIPVVTSNTKIVAPKIDVDDKYNPFAQKQNTSTTPSFKSPKIDKNWEKLFEGDDKFELEPTDASETKIFEQAKIATTNFMQIRNQYIITTTSSGVMLVDQKRAHKRVLYEKFLAEIESPERSAQQEIFPTTVDLNPMDFLVLAERIDDLQRLGFNIRIFGPHSVVVDGLPAGAVNGNAEAVVHTIVDDLKDESMPIEKKSKERFALALANAAAIDNKNLTIEEMNSLVGKLLACKNPNISPEGKPTFTVLTFDELEKRFLK